MAKPSLNPTSLSETIPVGISLLNLSTICLWISWLPSPKTSQFVPENLIVVPGNLTFPPENLIVRALSNCNGYPIQP